MLSSFQFIMTYWTLLETSNLDSEPIARIYLDDCIKYIGEDTKDLKYGDLLCVYSMTLSEHSLYAIQLSNYKLHKLDTSVCALEGKGYALAKDTKVKIVLDSTYTEVGQTGKIYRTDYRVSAAL